MKVAKKIVPELRFLGFEGNWGEKKLINFSTLQRGFDLTKATRVDGRYPVFSSSGISYYHNEYKVAGPGIVTGRKGKIGEVFYVEESFWPHDTTLWVKDFHDNCVEFVYWFLTRFKLERHDASTSVPTLNRNNVHNIKIFVPAIPEQKKIASFLSAVDKKIEKLTRKKELLEKYKKGVMQKIFSREIRFKDENGKDYPDWEENRLGDFVTEHNSGVYKKRELYGTGQNIVGVSNLYSINSIDGQKFRCAPLTKEEINQFSLKEGDLLYGESSLVRDGIAKTLYVTKKGANTCFAWHTRRYKVQFEEVNPAYLYYYLNSFDGRKRIVSVATQTALTGITTKDYFNIIVLVPEKKEQKKIANFLSTIDKKIEAVQTPITQTQEFKKGLLQKMFV